MPDKCDARTPRPHGFGYANLAPPLQQKHSYCAGLPKIMAANVMQLDLRYGAWIQGGKDDWAPASVESPNADPTKLHVHV